MEKSTMPVWRRYWVEVGTAVVALLVLIVGFRLSFRSDPIAVVAPQPTTPQISVRTLKKRLSGKPIFSLDVVQSGTISRTIGGMDHQVFSSAIGNALSLFGWAVEPRGAHVAQDVGFELDGKVLVTGTYGGTRADVGALFHSDALENAGFAVQIPPNDLPAGRHRLSLIVFSADGTGYFEAPDLLDVDVPKT